MFHGIKGPQSGRTPRTQAEKMNDGKNFVDDTAKYDPAAGLPITVNLPKQTYEERPMKPAGAAKPIDVAVPFTLTTK